MKRSLLIPPVIAVAACSVPPHTGDRLVDLVVSREGGQSPCVSLGGPTPVYADEIGPQAMPRAASFRHPEIRQAAIRIQTDWRDTKWTKPELFGLATGDNCPMLVNRPSVSGDYAFVRFSYSRGETGAYAFRHANGQWFVAEKVTFRIGRHPGLEDHLPDHWPFQADS